MEHLNVESLLTAIIKGSNLRRKAALEEFLINCNSIWPFVLVYHDNFDLTFSAVSLPFACASATRVCACEAIPEVSSLAFNARDWSRPPALCRKS
jgi:hypothetical protein